MRPRCFSLAGAALLAAAVPILAGCGAAPSGDFLSDGTYMGTDSAGNEYAVVVSGKTVTLNGAETEVDDTKRDTAFQAKFAPGKPSWECHGTDGGTAASCRVTGGGKTTTIDLMKENE